MELVYLFCAWAQVAEQLGLSGDLIREIWGLRVSWHNRVDKNGVVQLRATPEGVQYLATDLYGNLAVRVCFDETSQVFDIVSVTDPNDPLVRLVPYHLRGSKGAFPGIIASFYAIASFSLCGTWVALAVYQYNEFIIYVLDVKSGQEVKCLFPKCQTLGQYNRLCFTKNCLYFCARTDCSPFVYVGSTPNDHNIRMWSLDGKWAVQTSKVEKDLVTPRYIAHPQVTVLTPQSYHATIRSATNLDKRIPLVLQASTFRGVVQVGVVQLPVDSMDSMVHYREDLKRLWIATRNAPDLEGEWVLAEINLTKKLIVWNVYLSERPSEMAVSRTGTWLVLSGPHTLVRLNRTTQVEHDLTVSPLRRL